MNITYILHKKWVRITLLILFGLYVCQSANAQLLVQGSLVLNGTATVQAAGNVTISGAISGTGVLELNGEQQALQNSASVLPKLKLSNGTTVQLANHCSIGQNLDLQAGKLVLNDATLSVSAAATITNASANSYLVTNALGHVQRECAQAGNYLLPVGSMLHYFPIAYTVSAVNGTGHVGARFIDSLAPSQSVLIEDRLSGYWKTLAQNVTITNAETRFLAGGIATGFASNLRPLVWQGERWLKPTSANIDTVNRIVNFGAIENGYHLAANNQFVWVTGRVFLQGAYVNGSGRMADNLRTPTNLIPLADPYRKAPYATNFSHTNNAREEVARTSLFLDQFSTDNNIVDWVFLELRNAAGALVGTRSVLVNRSGRLIDIDGNSAIYFKNADSAQYTLTVRHRNHLGIASDVSISKGLGMAVPSNIQYNFTGMADADLFGNSNAYATSSDGFTLLRAGNANSNNNIRYSGPSNDNGYLLSTILGGVSTLILNNVYSAGDLNMNRNVRYSGPGNDNAFLLSTVLGGVTTILISQQIPN